MSIVFKLCRVCLIVTASSNSLKQRYPKGFQDLCLYSEVCLQLEAYNFRLPARRFIQEIFQDINYQPVSMITISDAQDFD